jgi:XTP/dITP diphosphohydrolase
MKEILLATNNQKKVKEFQTKCLEFGIKILTPKSIGLFMDVEENGQTFEENALLKSRFGFEKTGIPTISDDSGICVDALGGQPGIYSARYGDPSWDDKKRTLYLLDQMKHFLNRKAKYVCAISFIDSKNSKTFYGECFGLIEWDYDEKGIFGFGYDPIFYFPTLGERFSRTPTEYKNSVSHRGIAMNHFINFLRNSKG